MASTFSPLGVELQATGENAGTWGTKTNTNLEIVEQISGGFTTQAVSDSGDTDLSVTDGGTGATLAHRIIEFTGSLTGSRNVTIPKDVQQFYVLKNSTSGSQNVVFKYVSGSGDSVTISPGAVKLVYATANDGTNPDIDDCGFITASSTDTLTNKTLTAPKIADAGFIADANGAEQIIFQTTASAVNELEVTNAATGNNPAIAASGGDTNVGLEFSAKGSGFIKFNDLAYIPQQALTSSSNAVAWDVQAKPNAYHLTTENTTFSAPTNNVEGSFICLEINYNGSHTIAFNTVFEFAGSTAPTFTSTDGKTDILVFRYNGAVWQEVGRTLNLSES